MSQRQFLPLPDDVGSSDSEHEFDLSNMSALEYLKQVRFERRKIPEVVTIQNNYTKSTSEQHQEVGSQSKLRKIMSQ